MASGGVRVHPSFDMGARAFGRTGGPSMSRQSASEMFQELTSSKTPKSQTLEEAYWSNHQRKVGINRIITRPEPTLDDEYLRQREEQINFVQSHFHQKECRLFIPVPGQTGNGHKCKAKLLKCHCGETLAMHAGMRAKLRFQSYDNCFLLPPEYASILNDPEKVITETLPVPSVKWKADECLQTSGTNAFGKIDFNVEQIGGKKPAKYVRLCAEDSIDDCLELMQKFWHIMEPEPPHLVISVVGGAKNFKLDGRMRETFSTGLIKAAKTTKAWLITSGFNMGVMKAVGQAVHEGQTFQWDNDRMTHVLRCIGIAPWGYVKGRNYLESSNRTGRFNAYYRTSTQILHKQPVPLNPDHTHFIFVDDGYRIRYGGVAEFRSKMEKKISSNKEDGGLGIPVVLLVVEGGTDALQDVSASLAQGIPVVVCAGTGRAADILAYAYNHTNTTHEKERVISDYHQDKLARKLYAAYKSNMKPGKEKETLEMLKEKVIGCCQREDLMTIFYMNKHEDLDLAILSVLLKVETNSSRESQLKLALTWDRADIAQEEIFREDVIWQPGSLEEFLTQALAEDKVDFVRLLLNNGIIMQEYLTIERLEYLYNSIPPHFYLHMILKNFTKRDHFTVNDIANFLRVMLDRYEDDKLSDKKKESKKSQMKNKVVGSFRPKYSDMDTDNEDEPNCFQRPYKQLLIWAVLMNRYQLAHFFWELGEEPITSALVCSALCAGMEFKVPKYLTLVRNSFHEMKDDFERLAISVLDECHLTDPDKAIMLVERKSLSWSSLTCLQIAASASDQGFVSSVACQNSINNIWKSGIISSWPTVFLSAIFPPFIIFKLDMVLMGKNIMSKTEKIFTFYTAPLTKFSMYSCAYIGFLILFTYMLLVDYREEPSGTEWLAILWIFSLLMGAVHSFLVFPSPTFTGKLRDYFGYLDRLDFLNLILALVAFVVRWQYLYEAKTIYCINAVVFYLRLMKLYTANRSLGPKIYMINRMLLELAMFVMVLMVFLLAYGVSSQGLLYRQRTNNWLILKDILYFPYWQLYGEIFLEEIETDDTCTASWNTTNLADANYCRTHHWLVPILLALYLLIGNVLLLNLLIAIFSHVFDTVEKNAIEIWKFQMYSLVMEFQDRPFLFPPLSIFAYIGHTIRWIYHKVACRQRQKPEQFMKHHLAYLSLFEKEMMANKLRVLKASEMQSMDRKFHVLQTRMDELTRVIEDELVSEQYGMMATQDMGDLKIPKLADEMGLKDTGATGENNLESEPDEHKKKRKHKKKKKKKDKKLPDITEEKQLNITGAEEEKKVLYDKGRMVSDDENQSPDRFESRFYPAVDKASPSSTLTPRLQRPTLGSPAHRGITSEGSSTAVARELRSPIQMHNFSFPGNLGGDELDSDEEPIPIEIYSPRATGVHFSHVQRPVSPANGSGSDASSEGQAPVQQARQRKTRRHLNRRRADEDVSSRLQRASQNSFSNSLSPLSNRKF